MKRNHKRSLSKTKNTRHGSKQSQSLSYDTLESRQMLAATTGFDVIGASQSDPAITSTLANPEGDVGPNHFVEFGEQTYTAYSRDGVIVESSTLNQFFVDAGGDLFGENIINPRVVFDRATERWVAVGIGDNSGPLAGNWIHIAVSQTSDPTGQWQQEQFVPGDTGTLLATEISLGVDAAGIYLATRNVQLDELGVLDVEPESVSVFSIPKADLFGPATPTAANLTEFANLDPAVYGERIQFASNFDAGDGTVYAFSENSTSELNTFQITNAGQQTPEAAVLSGVTQVIVDVGNIFDPNIQDAAVPSIIADEFPLLDPSTNANGQLVGEEIVVATGLTSSLIETDDGRIFGARTVTFAFDAAAGDIADFRSNGIHWFELTVDGMGGTPTLAEGTGGNSTSHLIIDDAFLGDNNGDFIPEFGAVSYFNPSIAFQPESGALALVYNGVQQFFSVQVGAVPLANATRISTFASVGLEVTTADGRRTIQLERPVALRQSTADDAFNPVGPNNFFGGYSSLRPDPSNPNGFFATIPFVNSVSDQWDVQVVELIPSDLSPILEGTDADDVIIVRRFASDTRFIEIEINEIIVDRFDSFTTGQIIVLANGGNDTIIIDHSNGDPTPDRGFILDGGTGDDRIETNTAEDVEFLVDSLNDDVNIPFPAYLGTKLLDGRSLPLNDTNSADGELTALTLNGESIAAPDIIRSQLIDIEELASGSGDDTFIFQVGPLANSAFGGDGNDRFVFVGDGSVDGSINGGAGFNTVDVQQRNAPTNIELFATGSEAGFNGRTINGPVGQFSEVLDQFRDISLIRGSVLSATDSLQALNSTMATFTVVIPNISPDDSASPDDAEFFVASTYQADDRTLYFTDFDNLIGSVIDDEFNVQSNSAFELPELILDGRTGDDVFNFSSDAPVNQGTTAIAGGVFFVEGGGGENEINVSEFSQPLPQEYLVLNARITGPVEVVYTDTNAGNFEVNITGSNTAEDTFFLQSFLDTNTLNVFGLGGDDTFFIQDLSQAEVNLFGGEGDDTYIIEFVGPIDDRDVLISDSIDAENDIVLIAGTVLDEVFIIDFNTFESDQFLFIGVEQFGFDGRGGDDEFFVRGISDQFPVILFGGDGDDTFYISSDAPTNLGDLTTLNNDLTIDGGSGVNQILISNENGAALDVVVTEDQITGLFNSGVLTYFGEGVFDLIDIVGSNGGDDRFLVQSFLAGNRLNIDGRLGEDEFIIGNASDVAPNVVGEVSVEGGSESDTFTVFLGGGDLGNVTINDSGFSGSDRFIVTGTEEDDTFDLNQSQLVTQVNTFNIGGFIERYTFLGTDGNDVFEIDNTNAEIITLLGGNGDDQFFVNQTNAVVSAQGGDGDDLFDVSDMASQGILFDGNEGSDQYIVEFIGASRNVNISDSGTVGNDEAMIFATDSSDVIQIDNSRITLTTGDNLVHNSTIENVTVSGEANSDTFSVLETNFDLGLDGGFGNDSFFLSSNAPFQTGDVSTILGDTLIEGGQGVNQLFVTNFSGTPANIVITESSISGLSGGLISYASTGGVFGRTDGSIGGIVVRGSNDATSGDLFDVQSISVGDTIRLIGLDGDDSFNIGNGISGDALFDGGDGSDTYNFEFGSSEPRDIVISDSGTTGSDSLNLVGSSGDDNILINSFGVSDGITNLTFNIPLNEIEIAGGLGNDTFMINGAPIAVVSLFGNAGVDTFIVNGTAGVSDLNLFGGFGNDSFIFNNSESTTRTDALGSVGDDTYNVGLFASGNLFLDGQDGSDDYSVSFLGSGSRRIDTRDTGTIGTDQTSVFGTNADDRIAVRTTRFLYDDEVVIFDENTERVSASSANGNDRIVIFGTRSPLLEVFAGAGVDSFIINSGARADELNLFGEDGNDRFIVDRTTVDTTTNLFGNQGNDRFSIGATANDDDGNLGLIRGELNIVGGGNTVGGEDQVFANDNGAQAQYSYLVTPTRISAIAGPANLPRDNFVGINYDSSTEFVRLDGTPLANLFEVVASSTTRFFFDGNSPNNNVGDRLIVLAQPNDGRNLVVTNAVAGDGFVSFTNGNETIQFENIELPALDGNSTSLTLGEDDSDRDEYFSTIDLEEVEDIEFFAI